MYLHLFYSYHKHTINFINLEKQPPEPYIFFSRYAHLTISSKQCDSEKILRKMGDTQKRELSAEIHVQRAAVSLSLELEQGNVHPVLADLLVSVLHGCKYLN